KRLDACDARVHPGVLIGARAVLDLGGQLVKAPAPLLDPAHDAGLARKGIPFGRRREVELLPRGGGERRLGEEVRHVLEREPLVVDELEQRKQPPPSRVLSERPSFVYVRLYARL